MTPMTTPQLDPVRAARALAHDVGKYVARTAHNVRDGAWTPDLGRMLMADLYDLRGERALRLFVRLAPVGTSPLAALPEWKSAHALLCELDTMEPALRSADVKALNRAAHLALAVERSLRELVVHVESGNEIDPKRGIP